MKWIFAAIAVGAAFLPAAADAACIKRQLGSGMVVCDRTPVMRHKPREADRRGKREHERRADERSREREARHGREHHDRAVVRRFERRDEEDRRGWRHRREFRRDRDYLEESCFDRNGYPRYRSGYPGGYRPGYGY